MKKLTVTLSIKEAFGVASLYDECHALFPRLKSAVQSLAADGLQDSDMLVRQLQDSEDKLRAALVMIDSADG